MGKVIDDIKLEKMGAGGVVILTKILAFTIAILISPSLLRCKLDDDKKPTTTKAPKAARGAPPILTSYEANGYTLYVEETKKSLGKIHRVIFYRAI